MKVKKRSREGDRFSSSKRQKINKVDIVGYFMNIPPRGDKRLSLYFKLISNVENIDYFLSKCASSPEKETIIGNLFKTFYKKLSIEVLDYLLKESKVDVNKLELLYEVCGANLELKRKLSLINILIRNGGDVNYRSLCDKRSLLIISFREAKVIELLLDHGATGVSEALWHIYRYTKNLYVKYKDSIMLFIYYGAEAEDVHLRKHLAIQNEHNDIVKGFCDHPGKFCSESILSKHLNRVFSKFSPKLLKFFDGETRISAIKVGIPIEKASKMMTVLPHDVVNNIGKFFSVQEMKDFSSIGMGKEQSYNSFKSKETLLEEQGYKIIDVEGDGNCFFRAIAFALEGSEDNHLSYRAAVVHQLIKYLELYFTEGEDVEGYIAEIENSDSWVDDDRVIHAMVDILRVNIHVYNSCGVDVTIRPRHGIVEKTIDVLYSWDHYKLVIEDGFNPLENAIIEVDPLRPPLEGVSNFNLDRPYIEEVDNLDITNSGVEFAGMETVYLTTVIIPVIPLIVGYTAFNYYGN